MHAKGLDITVAFSRDDDYLNNFPPEVKYHPITLFRGNDLGGSIITIINLYLFFRRQQFDIVQYTTPNASICASLAARWAGIPARIYAQWGLRYVVFSGILRGLYKLIEYTTCRHSTHIRPDSLGNLNFSITEGLYPACKGDVIWHGSARGVDMTKFDYSRKSVWHRVVRAQLQIDERTFVYGYIGRFMRDKGTNELLTAYKRIAELNLDTVLLMVGNSELEETLDTELMNWAKISSTVVFVDFTSEPEKYFSACDVSLLPSYREGFGNTVIESEAMGVPVIVTDIPGPTDAVIPGETGLVVKKHDPDDLFRAMHYLYKHQDECARMGERAFAFARDCFEQQAYFEHVYVDKTAIYQQTKKS
jgi:glycosyltransferase involved in cell wall biosynthesis